MGFDIRDSKITRVVRLEADDKVAQWSGHKRVSSHRDSWEGGVVVGIVVTRVVNASYDGLEVVAVKMESDQR